MAGVEDTNILSRSDRQTLYYAQQAAQDILQKGGAFTEEGLAAVWKLNDDFVARHISLAAVRTCSSYPSSFTVWSLFFKGRRPNRQTSTI